jgi:hypothetical protein
LLTSNANDLFFSSEGINHYIIAFYTPQQNDVTKHCHRRLVKTGPILLYDASFEPLYWPHAFHTTSYLVNRQPTSILQNKSLFESLFG